MGLRHMVMVKDWGIELGSISGPKFRVTCPSLYPRFQVNIAISKLKVMFPSYVSNYYLKLTTKV